ncbi:hypothetical protein GSH19_04875 [Lactobacillus sp. S2-2]|uniref:DUF5776 domain-containing protein n=1 Tax=Lactobacillus sp. S2-2 TaxID=2692917 RepID=UPI001F3DF4B4|nr:DUF5776 domain-containing protein [Lactobacillus sp. S2-2]MCF6515484.1 hypothetical protein [Lactobacillus sp. S2-2]
MQLAKYKKIFFLLFTLSMILFLNQSLIEAADKTTTNNIGLHGWGDNPTDKKMAVYNRKPIYLYRKANFNQKDRITFYSNKPMINKPMFVTLKYVTSSKNNGRYKVRDVNHKSETYGKVGYITAKSSYVRNVYYNKLIKHRITVTSANGINSYQIKGLQSKNKHYCQGTKLSVKKIVKHNLTTRLVLKNGNYVTGNKKLISFNQKEYSKKVKTKSKINLYKDADLKYKKATINKNKLIKINKTLYSHENDMGIKGTKRYQVSNGYITGNKKFFNKK